MNQVNDFLVHSAEKPDKQGRLLNLPRAKAKWEWMSFFVHRLPAEATLRVNLQDEEAAFVLLSGRCQADWGGRALAIGKRTSVFDGLPHVIYLPPQHSVEITAETVCEIAECRAPSTAKLEPKVITPQDVKTYLRGGGNASRQIVDVMPPDFPADKLILVEVYTPSGNWSSYPPHKHDEHKPPQELDLDEIYYYRIARKGGFAHQRLYRKDGSRDLTVTAHDGDVVLVRDGFHPVVAGHGYDVYYLNCLAGSARGLNNTEDSDHVWVKASWGNHMDPRVPIVK